jgi:preprotein translocase SecF subunit
VPFQIVPAGTKVDFIGKRHVCAAISAALLLVGIVALSLQGVRYGIDFAGGTEVQVRFDDDAGAGEGVIRGVVTACGVRDPSVVRYGETDAAEFLIRFRMEDGAAEAERDAGAGCPLTETDRARLAEAAAAGGGGGEVGEKGEIVDRLAFALRNAVGPLDVQRVEYVGPRVGAELRRDGLYAIGIASLLILAYIAFRFSARFAPGAIVALLHDVSVTAGIFVIFGMEFDLRVLAALLAIIGYSLNDTIIIYDRIRENMELRTKHDLTEVLNLSVNQTLARTILTSGTTMAAVLALLFLGGPVIRPFAIAMAIGIAVGTYSSIFIAAPTLLFLESRFGGGEAAGAQTAGAQTAGGETTGGEITGGRTAGARIGGSRPSRGKRKKGKKKRK